MADLKLENDKLSLLGRLNVDTVNVFYDQGLQIIDKHAGADELKIDLSDTDIVGSAAVALLIAWQRRALEQDKQLAIINAPEHFLAMASVSGVRDILPFAEA